MKQKIVEQTIYSEKYHVYGKWILNGNNCFLGFMYGGSLYRFHFRLYLVKRLCRGFWMLQL